MMQLVATSQQRIPANHKPLRPGERYKLLHKIAKTGTTKIHLAFDVDQGHDVILKVVSRENPDVIRALVNEARMLEKRISMSFPEFYEYGELSSSDFNFIAMEAIPGRNLSDLIKMNTAGVPWWKAVGYVREVGQALKDLHEGGYVHQDIKPANIILPDNGGSLGSIRLIDLGLACGIDAVAPKIFLGTPEYASPEQVKEKKTSVRSDIYSLGIVLFELLTGKNPMLDKNWARSLTNQLIKPFPELPREALVGKLNDVVFARLRNIIAGMTAKDPADRPQNIDIVLEALGELGPPPFPDSALKYIRLLPI
ncbi:hypothetical protein A3H38_03800 [candidate division WOR-1 bacterium RIFCSPLOWO2_02_FULL_46_20]|uniref:non-specific serine/threonine protein kinase n=1 Tax=candidate division WOR-1 bacterium RIFCSPLOWO2_02_FULL_46_20 TaxID=1802567 RepID=A0A1F4RFU3_UNCSA|nr:MAG: hypothetical protein A3H38_03800 [candidate division WOR-1 bacterium RIFCSPLOWO2_02_FULL_46_20]